MGTCSDKRAAQPIQISGMDSRCEVHTIVIDNLDGSFTAHNFDGTTETWNGTNTFTTIMDNGDGTITAVNEDGTIITWDKDDQFSTVTDNGDGTITAINIDGSIITWDKTDTFSRMIDNGDGTITGINVDGTIITWAKDDTFVTLVNNGNGTITGTNVDGSTITWSQVDTFVVLVDNGDGTISGTNVDGSVITWDDSDTNTYAVIVDNGDGSYTATNADGSVVTWDTGDAICDLTAISQGAVDIAVDVKVAACVDGSSVLIPYIEGVSGTVQITEGVGIDVDSAPIGDDVFYQVSLDLCELPPVTKAAYDLAADTSHAICIDGDSRKVSREEAYAIFEQHIGAGTDIEITGTGTEADPYIIANTQTEVFISAVQGDTNGGLVEVDGSNNITITRSDGVEWTMHIPESNSITLIGPHALWASGEQPNSALPWTDVSDISAWVPATAQGIIVRVQYECDSGSDGIFAVESNITLNGQLLGSAETGGPSGSGDDTWAADFFVPYVGVNVTALAQLAYDNADVGSFQTSGRLVGWF